MMFPIGKDLKHPVHIKLKPERPPSKTYSVPADIVRPSARTMEPVYTDGQFLYRVAPFLFQDNQTGYMMACTSFMYYGIATYDPSTGRFLKASHTHTDKSYVQNKFNALCSNWIKLDDPYVLYDLRIKHGYLY